MNAKPRTSRAEWSSQSGSRLFFQVPAKGEPHRREELIGVVVRAARAEPGKQGRAQDRRRNPLVDGRGDRPSAFARVRDPARKLGELGTMQQGLGRQVEQPRGDDAPAPPDLGDIGQVQVVLVELRMPKRRGLGIHVLLLACRYSHA